MDSKVPQREKLIDLVLAALVVATIGWGSYHYLSADAEASRSDPSSSVIAK